MSSGLGNSMHVYMLYLEAQAALEDLERRYQELDAKYQSLRRSARATAVSWVKMLDEEDGDPQQLAIVPDACGAAAS